VLDTFYSTACVNRALDIDAQLMIDSFTLLRFAFSIVDIVIRCSYSLPVQAIEALLHIASFAKTQCPRKFELFLFVFAVFFD
jgi:hypothetical protein